MHEKEERHAQAHSEDRPRGCVGLCRRSGNGRTIPSKPIEVIVGYSAGGGTDVMARTVAPFIEKYLGDGASVVVKNMPGASGQIGITAVATAEPDGYTLGTFNLPGMMARTIDRKADYDADSFTYLANVVNDPNVIVTSKQSGLDTLDKLIAAAKTGSRRHHRRHVEPWWRRSFRADQA